MRLADAIPIASTIAPPTPTSSIEPLRAAAPRGAEIVDESVLRRVDQVELSFSLSRLPLEFWAQLFVSNARQPAATPVPYWAALEYQRRIQDEVAQAADLTQRPRQSSAPNRAVNKHCECDKQATAPYAGPSLGDVSPVKATTPSTQIKMIDVMRVYAPAGNIIDVFI